MVVHIVSDRTQNLRILRANQTMMPGMMMRSLRSNPVVAEIVHLLASGHSFASAHVQFVARVVIFGTYYHYIRNELERRGSREQNSTRETYLLV